MKEVINKLAEKQIQISVDTDNAKIQTTIENNLKMIASQISNSDNKPKITFGLNIEETRTAIQSDLNALFESLEPKKISISGLSNSDSETSILSGLPDKINSTVQLGESLEKIGSVFTGLSKKQTNVANGGKAVALSQLILGKGIKATTSAILAQTAAFLASPLGIATIAISAISLIGHCIKKNNEKIKNSTENLKKFSDQWTKSQNSLHSNSRSISKISDDYVRLSQGVDSNGNNLSLSSKEFEKYHNITKQIADMFPELVKGWDANGNAIIKNKGNVEELNKALEEQKMQGYKKTISETENVWDDFETSIPEKDKQKTIGLKKVIDLDIESMSDDEIESFAKKEDYDGDAGEYLVACLNKDEAAMAKYKTKILNEYTDLINKLEENSDITGIKSRITSLLNVENEDFKSLPEETQNIIEQTVSNLDHEFFLTHGEDSFNWIEDNILKPLTDEDTSQEVKDAMITLLNPPKDLDKAEYDKVITEALENLPEKTQEQFKKAFNLDWVEKPDVDKIYSMYIPDFSSMSSEIDRIQSCYSSLSKAVDEYNSSGVLSIDTLQSLLSATDGYLGYLMNEEGQLDLNAQGFTRLAKAKIMDLGISKAIALTNSVIDAVEENKIQTLEKLAGQHHKNANSIWEENLQKLESLHINKKISDTQYTSYVNQIQAIRTTTKLAANNTNLLGKSVTKTSNNIKKSASDIRSSLTEAQSSINNLLSKTISMLKQEYNDRKEGYQEQIDHLKEVQELETESAKKKYDQDCEAIDLAKEKLQAEKDYHDYKQELTERQSEIEEIQDELQTLKFDNSLEGQKRISELEEELSDKKIELSEYQYEHSIETQQAELDNQKKVNEEKYNEEIAVIENQYQAKIDGLNRQITAIEEYLSKECNIRNEAIRLIEGRSKTFYSRLIAWNQTYGDGIDQNIKNAWDDCYKAMDRYGGKQTSVLGVLNDLSKKIQSTKKNADNLVTSLNKVANTKLPRIKTQREKDEDEFYRRYGEKISRENSPYNKNLNDYRNVSFRNPGDHFLKDFLKKYYPLEHDLYASYFRSNNSKLPFHTKEYELQAHKKKFFFPELFHSGGLVGYSNTHVKYKDLFNLANDEVPAILQKGEAVFTRDHLNNLNKHLTSNSYENYANGSVSVGDIVIQGNADTSTVNALKQARDDIVNTVFKTINSSQKNRGSSLSII